MVYSLPLLSIRHTKLAKGYPIDGVSEDGQSRMPVYNGYMTVEELIDIASKLQPHYDVLSLVGTEHVLRPHVVSCSA